MKRKADPGLDALESQYLSGDITHAEYQKAVYRHRREQRDTAKDAVNPSCTLVGPNGENLDKEWEHDR